MNAPAILLAVLKRMIPLLQAMLLILPVILAPEPSLRWQATAVKVRHREFLTLRQEHL